MIYLYEVDGDAAIWAKTEEEARQIYYNSELTEEWKKKLEPYDFSVEILADINSVSNMDYIKDII